MRRIRERVALALGIAPLSYEGRGSQETKVELRRATQAVRCAQSGKALPVVVIGISLLVVDLWDIVARGPMMLFAGAVIGAALIRASVCAYIDKKIDIASIESLNRFEVWLFWTAAFNSCSIGAGFWLVAGPREATFDMALASCLYAIGAMINASVETRPFVWSIVANLGQGVLFSFGVGPHFDPFIGFMLLGVSGLLISFGQANGKRFEQSFRMREANVRLVQQLNGEKRIVERALMRAREAVKEQGRFLAAASHDLRQPLHAMNLYLDPLRRQVAGSETESIVEKIVESSDLLGEQLNAMLDLSRLDAGVVEVENQSFPLARLLGRIADECRAEAEEKGLIVEVELVEADAFSDPVLLDRVVRNLLHNAIRYTEGGVVSLLSDRQGDQIRINVRDTGPGISQTDQARIFEDFVQLGNPGRLRSRGVGLGLASVRRIDQLMNLELQLHSQVGKGSDFVFWIPSADGSDRRPIPKLDVSGESLVGLRVWAIDDDPHVVDALDLQLRSMGCEALVVTSREQLKKGIVARKWPDVALIDDMLAGDDSGFDIAMWLREKMPDRYRVERRIVLLTGNSDPARLEKIRENGFRLIQKPMRAGQLEALLQHIAAENRTNLGSHSPTFNPRT